MCEIERFVKILVEEVRDAAIESSETSMDPDCRSLSANRWKKVLADAASTEEAIRILLPDIVDTTIFHLLYAIDNGELPLTFGSSNEKCTDLLEEGRGELAGQYIGLDEWRKRFSKKPFSDDFANL